MKIVEIQDKYNPNKIWLIKGSMRELRGQLKALQRTSELKIENYKRSTF